MLPISLVSAWPGPPPEVRPGTAPNTLIGDVSLGAPTAPPPPPNRLGSQTRWRMAMALPAGLQNSHQNGGRVFLIFVADPRTVRLCMTLSLAFDISSRFEDHASVSPGAVEFDCPQLIWFRRSAA